MTGRAGLIGGGVKPVFPCRSRGVGLIPPLNPGSAYYGAVKSGQPFVQRIISREGRAGRIADGRGDIEMLIAVRPLGQDADDQGQGPCFSFERLDAPMHLGGGHEFLGQKDLSIGSVRADGDDAESGVGANPPPTKRTRGAA